jgi:phospholipid/cholesterol/gamma-HCH transport system substrate-binding protein
MEIRARYVLMGVFTLAVIFGIFAFLYWMHTTGGLRDRAAYRVQVENSVSGLQRGAAVLFNGIRVGEVTDIQLDQDAPTRVMVTVAVNKNTPVRSDTVVDIDFQGLTGVAFITMRGGSPNAKKLVSENGKTPLIIANSNGQTMGQAARDTLHRLNTILDENSKPLHETINNIKAFSAVLAKNTERAQNIIEGLERMTGGGKAANAEMNDLIAVRDIKVGKPLKGQLVIGDPTTLIALDTQNVVVKHEKADPKYVAPRWTDNLPKLIQTRVLQSFENSGFLGSVSRPGDGATADFQLLIDIRSFQATLTPKSGVEVELTAKILDSAGKVVKGKVFKATQSAGKDDVTAVAALQTAFKKIEAGIVVWTVETIANVDTSKQETPKEEAPL